MSAAVLPRTFRRIICQKLSQNFREATRFIDTPMLQPGPGDLLIKNRYVGINASDINFTAGRYANTGKPPFNVGFEAIGEIVAVGDKCRNYFTVGQHIAYMQNGAFSEYIVVNAKIVFPIPSANPECLPMMVSGMTAAIALDKVGEIKRGETVLVTAAAGGTGQFAVQLAKACGCHVIGTCSTSEKVEFLKSIGCDRPINYKKEELDKVLKTEYPNGVDVVYESVGAEMFNISLLNLAEKGRLIVIGYISGYESEHGFVKARNLAIPQRLLGKSASVRGFLLFHYSNCYKDYFKKLMDMYQRAEIKSMIDRGQDKPFIGLDSIPEAIQYLYSGKSRGKIVVEMSQSNSRL